VALAELAEASAGPIATFGSRPDKRPPRRLWVYLGVLPFFAYVGIFLLVPTIELIIDAFETPTHGFTLSNVSSLLHQPYTSAFEFSLEVSAVSALMGGVLGFLVANAVLHHGIPRFLRPLLLSFSGVAANFAGVPLAFAYLATIGPVGVLTALLRHLGLRIYPSFSLQGLLGLSLVYLYFQLPLMILLVIPAIEGLRKEWREAASNLGCSAFQFWRYVGMPVLFPSILGMMVLLFGNSFSAYATAETLGSTNLVTTWIAQAIDGNVAVNPQQAYALAFGMIVVIAITITIYSLLQRRASKWLR
jgi:putative spermidine/putrescine transport system permease protein